MPKTQWFAKESSLKHENSAYMHNISKYTYAGRLLKTSVSPFNLYRPKAIKKRISLASSRKESN